MDFCRALPCTIFLILTASHTARVLAKPASEASQATAHPASQPNPILESFRHDASLADVFFINQTTGWAVGDRGVIWHTQNGGTTWRQQSSSVTCRLNSVFFIDAHRGWAAGGEFHPHSDSSRGIVLRTGDGGNTWTPIPRLLLPQLMRIKFFDHQRGIAIGLASATQPSGAFVTQDGGHNWQPIPTDHDGGWLTGDFSDPDSGAVAGAAGRFAQLARRQIIHPSLELHSLRAFHAMRLLPPTDGWLVGDGGVVFTTKDFGHTWQSPPGEPATATGHFDFQALACLGPHVWIAGVPGTRIFHSSDTGQTWQSVDTKLTAPIRSITFVDAEHGWAVGDLGNILATTDGGRTWTSQRSGGQRAALLGIFTDAADVPLEVIAAHGAADGYLTAIDIVHAAAQSEASHEALLLAGATAANTAWRFPLPPDDLAHDPPELLAALNQATDGRASDLIEQHLVRSIRMWRPDVVITRHTNLKSCEPRDAILAAVVMPAINAAADPTRHIELANDAGLAPWQVKKFYGLLAPDAHGAESIATGQFSPMLAAPLNNFVVPAHQLLGRTGTKANRYDFDLLTSTIPNDTGPRGLFSGISLAPGSDARRPTSGVPVEDLDQLRRLADRRRHLEALLKRTQGNPAWVAQVDQITNGLSANEGAELLLQLGDGYRAAGQLDLAADTFYLLARRYADHAHAARALEWLIQFYASSETSHRLASRGSHNVRQISLTEPAGDGDGEAASAAGVVGAPPNAPPTIALSRDDRLHRATQLAEYLRTAKPELYAQPPVRFAEVAALRQLGLANPAKRYYLALRQLPETNPWRRCGDTETWLTKPDDLPPPKPLGACRPTTERPQLDAQLNEPFWDTADRLRLSHAADVGRTILSVPHANASDKNIQRTNDAEVRLAYDNEHLYFAIRCPKSPSPRPLASSPHQPRLRDADLSQHDRVTLRFDIDRDFTTSYELSVDCRGWTHDACWGDEHWNPTWYVAAASDEETWTIEAAVPLSELTESPPAARHVWAISACRTIPRVGYQAWTAEPAADTPDRFGFLIFE
jgi:photosystem II stability/assembly factor-like uncharacterized protein